MREQRSIPPEHAKPARNKAEYSSALNGYRGLCALLVFLFHTGSAGVIDTAQLGANAEFLWRSLSLGVEMFFMISGYVILGSLLRHETVAGFLRDRFVRIYSAWAPALVAVALVCVVFKLKTFAGLSAAQSFGVIVANFCLLPPLAPVPLVHWGSWSLTFEWVFYLSASLAALLLRAHAPRWTLWLWALLVAAFVVRYPRAVFFGTGVVVFARRAWFEQRRTWLRAPWLSFCVFLLSWHALHLEAFDSTETLFSLLRGDRWLLALVAVLASVHMFASIVLCASREVALLQNATFQFLGKISYSFYLWHALVMALVKRPIIAHVLPRAGEAWSFLLFVVLSSSLSIVIAWLSWSVFEVRVAGLMQRSLPHKPVRTRDEDEAMHAAASPT
ncbi:MAG: hypothetical protein RL701_3726 [Pseudomonadota bacterium]|jgi:peptidoglycan/LPS O-acetylase OafA/YrhL